jgi:hypothetical protein
MMLYQAVKLFVVWGVEAYYREERIIKIDTWWWLWPWGWARAAMEIGNFGKRCATVEFGNL